MPVKALNDLIPVYESICRQNLQLIVDRYRARPDWPFIDTKLKLTDGRDFGVDAPELTIYSRNLIYTWIQGRALEALAGHLAWIEQHENSPMAPLGEAILEILPEVADRMEMLRARNSGRLTFMMSSDGQPLRVNSAGRLVPLTTIAGQANVSDLFYAKGLFAAGVALGHDGWREAGEASFRRGAEAILSGDFVTDQQPMDPRNPVTHVPGRVSHGPYMLALGGVDLMLRHTANTEPWERTAHQLLSYLLDNHINTGQHPQLDTYDYPEFLSNRGQLWWDRGRVICDPGHVLECVGLASRLLLRLPESELHDSYREVLVPLLHRTFELGYNPRAAGICKSVDLKTRQPVNDDMPWWNLPETIRAAVLVMRLCPQADRAACVEIVSRCHDALFNHYLNPDVYAMAVQTRNARGETIDVIPACPDADPCYHTGLSLLDAIEAIRRLQEGQWE